VLNVPAFGSLQREESDLICILTSEASVLLSMTGYGAARHETEELSPAIEVRALNNRYLKVSLRAADPYHLLEPEVEKVVRRVVRRGTLQIHLRCERQSVPIDYRINATALEAYLSQLKPIIESNGLGARGDMLLAQVLTLPGVVAEPGSLASRLEEDWPIIEKVLQKALNNLQQMRREEGQAMAQELLNYRDSIRLELQAIQARIPEVARSYRDRLYERVRTILDEHDVELDRNDLIKEVSIFSERSDIAEEVIRLLSHLDQFQEIMNETESSGRKLDFLTQEMFREANTLGAKAGDVDISRRVVEIKGILEKIRELVQNVE
jgi:uncharacterized protein (TIGR00255 family)